MDSLLSRVLLLLLCTRVCMFVIEECNQSETRHFFSRRRYEDGGRRYELHTVFCFGGETQLVLIEDFRVIMTEL